MNSPEGRSLDRSTADRIIQRALELDARRAEGLTEAQLREIAAELSISGPALDQALAELRASANPTDTLAVAAPGRAVGWGWRVGTAFSVAILALLAAVMISRLFP